MKRNIIIIVSLTTILVVCLMVLFKDFENSDEINENLNIGMMKANESAANGALSSYDIDIDDNDLTIDWSKYDTTDISLFESITINKSGIYNLTGTIENGMITIDTNEYVKLILNNVNISNENGPAIYVKNAKLVYIETTDGSQNILEDGDTYTDESIDSTIYSTSELVLGGNGTLTINANYQDGITSKDDLKIISGNYSIMSKDDGIKGKDSVYILGGNIKVLSSEGDGIKSTNNEDEGKGFVYISGGDFNISSAKQGIEAITCVQIDGGNIDVVKSKEGIESKVIIINDGEINIVSTDDGINISSMSESSTSKNPKATDLSTEKNQILTINGGNITISASGDSIDINGGGYITGGSVVIYGTDSLGNGVLDYDLNFTVTGGILIGGGGYGMFQNISSDSTTNNVVINFKETQKQGTKVTIEDALGNVIATYDSSMSTTNVQEDANKKSFSCLLVTTSELKQGETYTIKINDEKYETFTMDNSQCTIGNENMQSERKMR